VRFADVLAKIFFMVILFECPKCDFVDVAFHNLKELMLRTVVLFVVYRTARKAINFLDDYAIQTKSKKS